MDNNRNIDFIARHYRRGIFRPDEAFRKIAGKAAPVKIRRWTPARTAAAVAAAIVLSATAAIVVHRTYFAPVPEVTEQTVSATQAPEVVAAIDFDEAPLTAVVREISRVYGVEVTALPDNADSLTLTLRYEGSAADLVETINDILGTEMEVK